MPRPQQSSEPNARSSNPSSAPSSDDSRRADAAATNARYRTTALVGLVIAIGLAIVTWMGLWNAADAGVERVTRIDRARAVCDSGWLAARTMSDTETVDRIALSDTIDRGSSAELTRCGNMRPNGLPAGRPNPRDMSQPAALPQR